jgi:hypothetical protein
MHAWRVLRLMRPVLLALLGLLSLAGVARAGGGSIRALVLLPSEGRLAIVDVQTGQLARTVAVPHGPGQVAASVDGSRVLVANTQRGVVTEIDGRAGRRRHLFGGLGRPVDLALVPRAEFGLCPESEGGLPRSVVARDQAARDDGGSLRRRGTDDDREPGAMD